MIREVHGIVKQSLKIRHGELKRGWVPNAHPLWESYVLVVTFSQKQSPTHHRFGWQKQGVTRAELV